jgi:hypothetical protein
VDCLADCGWSKKEDAAAESAAYWAERAGGMEMGTWPWWARVRIWGSERRGGGPGGGGGRSVVVIVNAGSGFWMSVSGEPVIPHLK